MNKKYIVDRLSAALIRESYNSYSYVVLQEALDFITKEDKGGSVNVSDKLASDSYHPNYIIRCKKCGYEEEPRLLTADEILDRGWECPSCGCCTLYNTEYVYLEGHVENAYFTRGKTKYENN